MKKPVAYSTTATATYENLVEKVKEYLEDD